MRLSPKAGLWIVLAASLGLRLWLAAGGGQGYWPDENMRYGDSQTAAFHLLHGELGGLARELFGHADHLLFRWVALPPALLDEWLGANAFRAACYFSLFSIAIIGLVWSIVRREGGGEDEALLAATLAACANSLFFYARHFFPYDAAVVFMLAGLWVGMGGRPAGWRTWAAGVLVGAGFLTYNGYWLPGATVLALLAAEGNWRDRARRVVLSGAGLLCSIGGMVLVARLAGFDLLQGWQDNAATITQGDFGGGWRVIADYLWFTEGPVALMWGAALAGGIWLGWRTRDAALLRWLGAVGIMLAGLILLSDCVHQFVVYGRLVRPLVPFLCLVTARVIIMGTSQRAWPRWIRPGLSLAAAACAAWNFAGPLGQEFPADFLARARGEARRLQRERPGVVQVLRAEHLWGAQLQSELPPHDVILRAAHPLQYRPYQYEGFATAQRAELGRHDIAMRLIRLRGLTLEPLDADAGVAPPDLGPVRLRVRFPRQAAGRSEPLLTSGRPRYGDTLFVRYEDEAQVRFGLDHWGSSVALSEPVRIDPTGEHELILSLGSLMPAEAAGEPRSRSWSRHLRRLAFIALDGQPVFSAWQDFFPSAPGEAFIASNFIGGSAARAEFSGTVTGLARVPLAELARLLPFTRLAVADRGTEWEGAAGPWRLRFRLPPAGSGVAEPLFAAQAGGSGESLLLEEPDALHVRLRLERAGGVYRSEPIAVDRALSQEILLSSGTLYPEPGGAFFQRHPGWRDLKRLNYVAWNGRTVLLRNFEPWAGPTQAAAFGVKLDAGVSAREHFTGLMEQMEPVEPEQILRTAPRLVDRDGRRGAEWAGHFGPVRLRLQLPREFPSDGVGEPLLVSGVAGSGDFLALVYGPDGRVRFSYDHWGIGGAPQSEPVRIEPGATCEVLVSAGFLWPPADAPLYRANPALREMRARVIVAVNGQKVLDAPAAVHAATPESLTLGVNFIGGSTTAAGFTGLIEKAEPAAIAELLSLPPR